MKITHIFSILIFLLLSACGSSTDTDGDFPTDARDFMFVGNPGTEIVLKNTYTKIDTSGIIYGPDVLTFVWTIMERDVLHPIGGKSIRMREESRTIGSLPSVRDSVYFAFYNNSIVRYYSIRDTAYFPFLKNPLTVGSQWAMGKITASIKSVGEIVNTTFRPLKAIVVESIDSSSSNQKKIINTYRSYYAPEVFLAKGEEKKVTVYPDQKTRVETEVVELVQYTKK